MTHDLYIFLYDLGGMKWRIELNDTSSTSSYMIYHIISLIQSLSFSTCRIGLESAEIRLVTPCRKAYTYPVTECDEFWGHSEPTLASADETLCTFTMQSAFDQQS